MTDKNVMMDGETTGLIERLRKWDQGRGAPVVDDAINALTRLSIRAFNWRAQAEARRIDLASALDSPTVEAIARLFRRSSSDRSLSEQIADILEPRLRTIQPAVAKDEPVLLGEGTLTWDGAERRSDRYGAVYLIEDGHNSFTKEPSPSLVYEDAARRMEGRKGVLGAVVLAARESTHVGDLFRQIFPRTQEVGQVIELGRGTLFTGSAYYGGLTVGLRPDDGRTLDWLDPRALYDAHEQTVKLFFHPEPKESQQ